MSQETQEGGKQGLLGTLTRANKKQEKEKMWVPGFSLERYNKSVVLAPTGALLDLAQCYSKWGPESLAYHLTAASGQGNSCFKKCPGNSTYTEVEEMFA